PAVEVSMVKGERASAKQRLLADGDALEGLRIDAHAQPRTRQGRRPAAPAKRNVLRAQGLAHQVTVVRPLDVAAVRDAGGEMPAGRGEDGGFPDLAAELITQAVPPRQLSQPQRWNQAATLGQTQIKQVARLVRDGPFRVDAAT